MNTRNASAKPDPLSFRSDVQRAIRDFFYAADFIEVDTPIRVRVPALEDHIDAEPTQTGYLRTSPELHMKRLVQSGHHRIFQLGSCFRLGEHGRRHRSEFTMLEWYQSPGDYTDLMSFTSTMLQAVVQTVFASDTISVQGKEIALSTPWQRLTVEDAYQKYAGMTAQEAIAAGQFDELMVTMIEPQLGWQTPTFLLDYPAELGALARLKPDDLTVAERWELYIGGIELANAYSELTDAAEQRRRFEATAALRESNGSEVYPIDEPFMSALAAGMPDTAGCALGFDRLLMVLLDSGDIGDVIAFDEKEIAHQQACQ